MRESDEKSRVKTRGVRRGSIVAIGVVAIFEGCCEFRREGWVAKAGAGDEVG